MTTKSIRQRDFCTTDAAASAKTDTNQDHLNTTTTASQLLTRATARQLKGDIPHAIRLTKQAIELLNKNNNAKNQELLDNTAKEELSDALLFLGKLHQLDGNLEEAVDAFCSAKQHLEELHKPKKYYTALSHEASAKARWLREAGPNIPPPSAETIDSDFQTALEGLEQHAGWSDGMTNHTAHQWSRFCRQQGDPKTALQILTTMKENLTQVFGTDDSRVLQLNGEMAELWQQVSSSKQESTEEEQQQEENDNNNGPNNKAVALLEEALEKLPPNSPGARRIFMQLEEWKDNDDTNETDSAAKVVVTTTKGSNKRRKPRYPKM